MDEVLRELQELRKEINKIKEFCGLVAVEHKHIPSVNQKWYNDSDKSIYRHAKPWDEDLNNFTGGIMKALVHNKI